MAPKKKNQRVRRLDEIRPMEVAKSIERALQKDRAKIDEWLAATDEKDDEGVPLTKIGKAVKQMTSFAQGDDTSRPGEARTLARKILSDMLSNLIMQVDPDDPAIEKINPYMSELTVVAVATLGRARIELDKGDVPDAWLAALLSLKTGSIRTYVCLDQKPGVHLERPKGESGLVTWASAKRILSKKDKEVWTE